MEADGFEAQAKLLFDKTVTEQLDIESILFYANDCASCSAATSRISFRCNFRTVP